MKKYLLIAAALLASAHMYGRDPIVVDASGGGDFRTVQEAVNSVRDFLPEGRAEIFIKEGVYREKLVIPANKCSITLRGEDMFRTVISWGDYASLDNMGTFRTHTLFVGGNDIVIENLTVENSAGEVGQAVALHLEGDRTVVRNCRIMGNQDTVYAGRESSRHYFSYCHIEGTTDFIFGPAAAWFVRCGIHCKKNSYITAASTPANQPVGLVFDGCTVTAAEGVTVVYLGRPWRPHAMTLYMDCFLPGEIRPEGWDNWRNPDNELTARYMEYGNCGPGADTSGRVAWSRLLTGAEAEHIKTELDPLFSFRLTLTD